MAAIPVSLISGYLGAGKTTLVNRLLAGSAALGRRFAVIVNEFGQIGIDHELLVQSDEGIVELSNGCLCCTVRSDLIEALERLQERAESFDHVLVETTGIAEPGPLVRTFLTEPAVQKHFRLDGVVTVVDAYHLEKQLDAELECVEQIGFADVLVLNKLDLIDAARLSTLQGRLRAINPRAPLLTTQLAEVPLTELLGLEAYELDRPVPQLATPGPGHSRGRELLQSFVLREEAPLDAPRTNGWLKGIVKAYAEEMYRYKGFLHIAGQDRKLLLQGVHELVDLGLGDPWPPEDARVSRLVFIGRDLPEQVFRRDFAACAATTEQVLR